MHSLSTVCGTVGPPSLSRGKVGVVLLDFDFGNLLRDWISTLQTRVFYESMCIRLCNGILSANMQISYAGNIDRAYAGLQRPTSNLRDVSQLWSVELHLRALVVYPPRALAAAASAMPCLQARHACTYPETHAINPSAFASSNAHRAAALGQMLVLVKVRHVFLLGQVLFERREVAQLVQLVGATGRAGLLLYR